MFTELAPWVLVIAAEMISRGWLFLFLSFKFYSEHKRLFYLHNPTRGTKLFFASHAPAVSHGAGCLVERRCPSSGWDVLPNAQLPQLLVQPRGAEGSALGSRAPFYAAGLSVSGESSRLWGRHPGRKLWILEAKKEGNAANPGLEGELTVLSLLKGVRWDPERSLRPLQALSPAPFLEC